MVVLEEEDEEEETGLTVSSGKCLILSGSSLELIKL